MSRKYLEQMIEEIEFTNYQRYLQVSLCPPLYSEFHNFCYSNRCDWLARGCFSPPYWLFPAAQKSGCESFPFLKRSDQFGFYKNWPAGKPLFKDNEFHQGRWIPAKGDRSCGIESRRRHFTNWNNGGPKFCRFKSSFDECRPQRRNPGRYRNNSEKLTDHFQRYQNERLGSLENLNMCVKNASVEKLQDSLVVPEEMIEKSSETKTPSSSNSSGQLSEKSALASSHEINNGCTSWFHAEEQQQIVNMLKEVNMRHERQLRRVLAGRSERPTSDDSTCSNADRASLSSDDEDDGIVVLVSPEKDGTPPEDPDEEKDIADDYLEKSASDYFEEFQSIFTVSPEKNIINSLTKECLKECAKSNEVANEAVLVDENYLSELKKQVHDGEDKDWGDSLNAMAETENGIREVKNEIASESYLQESIEVAGEDRSSNSDEPRNLLDKTSSTSRDPEAQILDKTLKIVEKEASPVYELNGKCSESFKTQQKCNKTSKIIGEATSSIYELNGKCSESFGTEEKCNKTPKSIEEATSSNHELNDKSNESFKTQPKLNELSKSIEETTSSVYGLKGKCSERFKTQKKINEISKNIEVTASSIYELNGKCSESFETQQKFNETSKSIDETDISAYDLKCKQNAGFRTRQKFKDTHKSFQGSFNEFNGKSIESCKNQRKFNENSKNSEEVASSEFKSKRSEGFKTQRKFNETSKNIEGVSIYTYNSIGKHKEGAVLNSVQRHDKLGNITDLYSSLSDITKIANQLHKKDVTSFGTKQHPLNSSQRLLAYKQPESAYSFPNRTMIYMQNSWPVDYSLKRSITHYKYKENRLPQCPSEAISKSGETAFLNKFPNFIRKTGIPEIKEGSDPHLYRRNETKLLNNIPITSFSDSYLPFKDRDMHYKRITVAELFQKVSQDRKSREFPKFNPKEHFRDELATASDHLKKILKIGKGNESQIHSPDLRCEHKFCDNDHNYRNANLPLDTNHLSGRYTPEGDSTGRKQIFQTRDDPGKSSSAKSEQTSAKNNVYDSRSNSGVNSQVKYENTPKNSKQGKFTHLSQTDVSSSLTGCGPIKPINQTKLQKFDSINNTNQNVDILAEKNSSKEGVNQKEMTSKAKRRKKLKNDKKVKNVEAENEEKTDFVVRNDKTDVNQDQRIRSDFSKHRENYDQAISTKNPACIDDGKYRNSWKNRKRSNVFLSSRKEYGKFTAGDYQSSNNLKTQISQQSSENCMKESKQNKVKDFTHRKNSSSYSKNCVSQEINKESTNATHQKLGLEMKEDDGNSGFGSKDLKVRDDTHSRENQHCIPSSSNRSKFPSKFRQKFVKESIGSSKNISEREYLERDDRESTTSLRQNFARPPRNFVSRKNFPDEEQLERYQAVKTRRNCEKLGRNYSEAYEKDSCSGDGNYFQKSNSFDPRKNAFKTKNKISSPSGTVLSLTTNIKEKFVLKSIYCYEKTSGIDDKKYVASGKNTTNIRKDEKQGQLTEEVTHFSDEEKQNSLNSELEDVTRKERTTGKARESNKCQFIHAASNFPVLQSMNYSERVNICACSFVRSRSSRQSQNTETEAKSNEKLSCYDSPSKESEISDGNAKCCLHAVDGNIPEYLHSAKKHNKDIESFVENHVNLGENTSTNICNKNSPSCQTSKRGKEDSGSKMAMKTTGGDFSPLVVNPAMPDENTSTNVNSQCHQTSERGKEDSGSKMARTTTGGDFSPLVVNPAMPDENTSTNVNSQCHQTSERGKEDSGSKMARTTTGGNFSPLVVNPAMPDENTSTNVNSQCHQTSERGKEDSGSKMARTTTGGDFSPTVENHVMPDENTSINSCIMNSPGFQTPKEGKEESGSKVAMTTNGGDFSPLVENPAMPGENTSANSCNMNSPGCQTSERGKEDSGIKVPRTTNGGDFTPLVINKKCSVRASGVDAKGIRSSDQVESFADNSSKDPLIRQPPSYFSKDCPEKESTMYLNRQKSDHCIDSNQPKEDLVLKNSTLTIKHPSQTSEIKSRSCDPIIKNTLKNEDLFTGITSQEIAESLNCKKDLDSEVESAVLGLPGTVSRRSQVLPGIPVCDMMSDFSVKEQEYPISNALTRKSKELFNCISSLNGANVQPESDETKTGESPEERLQLLTLSEDSPTPQGSAIHSVVNSCNPDTGSIGKSKKLKIRSESDLSPDEIALFLNTAQV